MHTQKIENATYVDALQYPVPDRRWFQEWADGGLSIVQVTVAIWENAHETFARISRWRSVARANGDLVAIATSGAEIDEIISSGRTAIVLGFQNTAPIEHNIDHIRAFRDVGVCVMQLTYNLQNYIGGGYKEEHDSGLSSLFGRSAVREMNEAGVLIDLSHCGDRTTLDTIRASERPVSVTHANPREFVGDPTFGSGRLKTSEALIALAERGGVVGLSPNRHMTRNGINTSIKEFCEMISWTVDLMGVDSVGLGTDYCPGHDPSIRNWWRFARWSRERQQHDVAPHDNWQDWFRNPSDFPNLEIGLRDHGFSDVETNKILGENWTRLFASSFQPVEEKVGASNG